MLETLWSEEKLLGENMGLCLLSLQYQNRKIFLRQYIRKQNTQRAKLINFPTSKCKNPFLGKHAINKAKR